MWPRDPGAPKAPSEVGQGQNYFHNITKMLSPFTFLLAHEYTMKFTRGFMKCRRSQQTECRVNIRLLKPDIKRSAKITRQQHLSNCFLLETTSCFLLLKCYLCQNTISLLLLLYSKLIKF